MKRVIPSLLVATMAAVAAAAEPLELVRVAEGGREFVLAESGRRFVPWGFNYDHDRQGRLLEDYWEEEWETVESDFQEMRELGANVVRIHLQFGKFMEDESTPRQPALDRLRRLTELASQHELRLDLTGLGCYHKRDVPAWYDALSEERRWAAQGKFWEAVAAVGAGSPAIFCYDLMNEPVVPGGDGRRDDWLGPAFGDKHFVQFVTLERAGRERTEVARQWIHSLVSAIRKHDQRHLVTVGLVPWSLDRPGLTSGFVPEKIAPELDFLAVHLYPERDQVDQALETLHAFAAAGKPVVIEEIFPLKCGIDQFGEFLDRSRVDADGWIGFYWGVTPAEYDRPDRTIGDAITLEWLKMFQQRRDAAR